MQTITQVLNELRASQQDCDPVYWIGLQEAIQIAQKYLAKSPTPAGDKTAEEIIEKKLCFAGGTDDKWFLQASATNYLDSGKLSGSFFGAIKTAMSEYADQKCAPLSERIAELEHDLKVATTENKVICFTDAINLAKQLLKGKEKDGAFGFHYLKTSLLYEDVLDFIKMIYYKN